MTRHQRRMRPVGRERLSKASVGLAPSTVCALLGLSTPRPDTGGGRMTPTRPVGRGPRARLDSSRAVPVANAVRTTTRGAA